MKQVRTLILFVLLAVAMLASIVQCSAQLNGNFGRVRLVPKSTVNSNDTRNGVMMYNDTLAKFRFYQNGQWRQLDLADTFNTNFLFADSIYANWGQIDSLVNGQYVDASSGSFDVFLYGYQTQVDILQFGNLWDFSSGAEGALAYDSGRNRTRVYSNGYWHDLFPMRTDQVQKYRSLDSNIKSESVVSNTVTSSRVLTSGRLELVSVYLYAGDTVSGVKFFNTTGGNYTASDSNKVALYSFSSGTLTLVAQSLSSATTYTNLGLQNVDFLSSYIPTYDGVYFVGLIYNRSAEVSAPTLAATGTITLTPFTTLENRKTQATLAGQTTTPASTTMAGITFASQAIWVALY